MSLSFYEKAFENNYEELITYYPAFYQQVYEMQEILKAQGKLADGIEAGIERAYMNNFIDYADAETIGNLETFLRLEHNRTKELEMRRHIVKAHFVGNGKLSGSRIGALVKVLYGEDSITTVTMDKKLEIRILTAGLTDTAHQQLVNYLNRALPAHIPYDIIYERFMAGSVWMGAVWHDTEIFELRQVDL